MPYTPPKETATTDAKSGVPWYLWPNVLSLDAVAVALVWLWCFASSQHIPVMRNIYIILGLVVWFVYTADRLLDAVRMRDEKLSTPRHLFARRCFLPLLVGCVIALGLAIWLVLTSLPRILVFNGGMVISVMVLLYFLLRCSPVGTIHSVLPKELLCGIIFALGTSFVVYATQESFKMYLRSPEVWAFGLLCGLNCAVISCWEFREDRANGDGGSIAHLWPFLRQNYVIVCFVFAVLVGWGGYRILSFINGANDATPNAISPIPNVASAILFSVALSAALIGVLGLLEKTLSTNVRRALVDVALLTPLLIVPLMR